MDKLREDLDNSIRLLEMTIVRAINNFERETGLAVHAQFNVNRDGTTEVVDKVAFAFLRYPPKMR
jgi:hypothetical protein